MCTSFPNETQSILIRMYQGKYTQLYPFLVPNNAECEYLIWDAKTDREINSITQRSVTIHSSSVIDDRTYIYCVGSISEQPYQVRNLLLTKQTEVGMRLCRQARNVTFVQL